MINKETLELNFYPVIDISKNIIRCTDELNVGDMHTYFDLRNGEGRDVLTVSSDHIDDVFATELFHACPANLGAGFVKIPFVSGAHDFTHLIIADNQYFSDLNGRMDEEKKNCVLAVPIFNCEFSDFETPEEFYELRRNVVPSNDWKRAPAPKIKFRYDNVKIDAGTGDGYIFSKLDSVFRDVREMIGSVDSFAEIINFRNDVLELLPTKDDGFDVIYSRDDAKTIKVPSEEIEALIQKFVTE
jgi:hypothetical protein